MAAKVSLSHAGFLMQHQPDQPVRWGVTKDVYKRQARFTKFIHECLSLASDEPGCLAVRMIGLDGIKPSSLEAIRTQESIPYSYEEGIAIEWLANGPVRTERRLLSSITLMAWPSRTTVIMGPCVSPFIPIGDTQLADLTDFLTKCESYKRSDSPLYELECDAMCWWNEALPPVLFSHCAELMVLSALTRQTVARFERKLAIAPEPGSSPIPEQNCTASDLIDGALISNGPDTSTAVIKTVLDILEETVSEVDGLNKRHWTLEIQKLANRAINAGPRTSILLAWVADMCESGTISESNPADSTVRAYIRRALLPLHGVLVNLPDDMEQKDWHAVAMRERYVQLVATQSSGNQSTMRAALSNFHHFLVNWFDVDPLTAPLHGPDASASVRAQAIHKHELDLAMEWAAEHGDIDMGLGAQLILGLAYQAPARAQELTRIRICNVLSGRDGDGAYLEAEIARHAASGRLKTPSSQRRIIIRSTQVIGLLKQWVERRRSQGATHDAFLFGDPSDDALRYRPAATLALINRLLKASTGDNTVSIHTLRHTVISNLTSDVLATTTELDINRIETIAAQAGHASGLTTLRVYTHKYERALRAWLDLSLVDRIEVKSDVVAGLLNMKSTTLRKMASRASLDVNCFSWRLLLQAPKGLYTQPASIPFQWLEPACPIFSAAPARHLTVSVMIAVLAEALKGTYSSTLAHRYLLEEQALEKSFSKLIEDCGKHASWIFPRKAAPKADTSLSLATSLTSLGIDFDRHQQDKYRSLASALDGNIDDSVLSRGLQSWERCYRGNYLSLENPIEALGMFTLLQQGGVDPTALRMCIQSASIDKSQLEFDEAQISASACGADIHTQILMSNVSKAFTAAFNLTPKLTLIRPNRDIPYAYLRWNSNSKNGVAAGTTSGLSALMIGIKAYFLYKEVTV